MGPGGETMTTDTPLDQRLKEWIVYIESSARFGSPISTGGLEDLRDLLREIQDTIFTK